MKYKTLCGEYPEFEKCAECKKSDKFADCTMKVCEKGTCHECPSMFMCDMGLVI